MLGKVEAQQERILRVLEAGPMTADKLDEVIGWRVTTAGRRLGEMKGVRMLKESGITRSGRSARLWERYTDG